MIGYLITAWFADRFGRVRAIQLMCALGVISAIIQASSIHITMFLIGRFFGGMT
jgi:MFS family permease